MTLRFDDALARATSIAKEHRPALAEAGRVRLVRDLFGRSRLAVEHRVERVGVVDTALAAALGAYWAGPTLVGDEMVAPQFVFGVDVGELLLVDGIEVVERVIVGADWTRGPLPNELPRPQRATLYGLKGGVGRSTAIVAWSQHLAALGERVLVVDLDLESPGVSSSLLPPNSTTFGVVDWLVEDAVGQADDELLRLMVASSPIGGEDGGEVVVAPCGGSTDERYLAKLSRAYLEVPNAGGRARLLHGSQHWSMLLSARSTQPSCSSTAAPDCMILRASQRLALAP